jgi:hypothetical protein
MARREGIGWWLLVRARSIFLTVTGDFTEASGHDGSHVSGEKHDPRVIGSLTRVLVRAVAASACFRQSGMRTRLALTTITDGKGKGNSEGVFNLLQ